MGASFERASATLSFSEHRMANDYYPEIAAPTEYEGRCWGCKRPIVVAPEEEEAKRPVVDFEELNVDHPACSVMLADFCAGPRGPACVRAVVPEIARACVYWKEFRQGSAVFLGSDDDTFWDVITADERLLYIMRDIGWTNKDNQARKWILLPNN